MALPLIMSQAVRIEIGGTVRSSRQWIRALLCALAVIAPPGCNRPVGTLQTADDDNPPVTREDVYLRQLDLDVAAIIMGMARAHGAQVVALTPGP
jgi:hypothetical protein